VKQTIEHKKYELKEQKGLRLVNLDKNKTLTGIQKRYKTTVTDEQSAFKNYTTSNAISNIRVRGIKALQYLKHQDFKMKEYLRRQNKGMKVMFKNLQHLQKHQDQRRGKTHSKKQEIRNNQRRRNHKCFNPNSNRY
jgi:ribosomal protein L35